MYLGVISKSNCCVLQFEVERNVAGLRVSSSGKTWQAKFNMF